MIRTAKPSPADIARFLDRQRDQPFTYPAPGATRTGEAPPGFDVDHRRREIGRGREAFAAACAAVRRWEMFCCRGLQPRFHRPKPRFGGLKPRFHRPKPRFG